MALVQVAGALRSCSITSFHTWTWVVEYFSITMPHHMLLHMLGVFAVPQCPDIILACPFTRFNPYRMSMGYTGSACTLEESATPRHFSNLLHCSMSDKMFHVFCNIWLLPCVTIVKLSSGLVVVITDTIILVTRMSVYIFQVDSQRYYLRHVQSNPLPMASWSWLLVSVLLLNIKNQCHVSFFDEYIKIRPEVLKWFVSWLPHN